MSHIHYDYHLSEQKRKLTEEALLLPGYNLPELPEMDAFETYELLEDFNRRLLSSNEIVDYINGSAEKDNEIWVGNGLRPGIVSAEHATQHVRHDKILNADFGTAAIAGLVHLQEDVNSVVMIGSQKSDANYYDTHPLKVFLSNQWKRINPEVAISIHGMKAGRFDEGDSRAYDVIFGVGNDSHTTTLELLEVAESVADELELRIGVNQSVIRFNGDPPLPVRNQNGQISKISFSGGHPGTMRSFFERSRDTHNTLTACAQMELASTLRLLPTDFEQRKDQKAIVMGTYLGYLMVTRTIQEYLAPDDKEGE